MLDTKKTIDLVTLWYKNFYSKKINKDLTINQLKYFESLLKKMKVVILAGGLGSRLSELTKKFQNQWSKLTKNQLLFI